MMLFHKGFCWVAMAILGVAFAGTVRADEAGDVKDIIAASGVRAGLCLHLGCGRPDSAGLTAALARNPDFVVHGLALDDVALARARERIAAKGVVGRAIAEKVACNPLPYLPDLANLVVVEDMAALTSRGVVKDEILRVLAPGGVLAIKDGGGWTTTVKPRPAEMDDWGHPRHGPDGNYVSNDKLIKFPLGLRWIGGPSATASSYGGQRYYLVVTGGRCFTFGVDEVVEDRMRSGKERNWPQRDPSKDYVLGARDAFNGLPLWKISVGPSDMRPSLSWRSALGPLVADAERVYAASKDKIVIVDAASGKMLHTCTPRYPAARLAVLDGVLLATCWEINTDAPWKGSAVGRLDAFDAMSGEPKWASSLVPSMVVASKGIVYVATTQGDGQVAALDLKTGQERWRVPVKGEINCCGPGFVVISNKKVDGKGGNDSSVLALSAKTGGVLWKAQPVDSVLTPLIDGLLWCDRKKIDPRTGEAKGDIPVPLETYNQRTLLDPVQDSQGDGYCQQTVVVGPYFCRTRWGTYQEVIQKGVREEAVMHIYRAARGACALGMTPANGMFYEPPIVACGCFPAQPRGFLAIGPSGEWPTAADFEKPRPVEKGPAFGAATDDSSGADNWPTYRHDPERTAATPGKGPKTLKEVWKVQVTLPFGEGLVAEAWKERLASPLTAPVVAGGLVFAADTHAGQILALDAATGKRIWTATLGGRVNSPPTIHQGICLVGCRDGWVYALRAKDGQLAWRLRVAPWERRMPVNGQMESVWPAIGSVLVHGNVAFANAGRTTESDGGIAVVAFDPASGAQLWCKQVADGPDWRSDPLYPGQRNDLLVSDNDGVGFHNVRLDPKTGNLAAVLDTPTGINKTNAQDDILDDARLIISSGPEKFGRTAFIHGKVVARQMAWNDQLILTPAYAATAEKAAIPKGMTKDYYFAWKDLPTSDHLWPVRQDCRTDALVLVGDAAIYAGHTLNAKRDAMKGVLRVMSLANGKNLAEMDLDCSPVFDGVAASGGRLFVSLENGMLMCVGE